MPALSAGKQVRVGGPENLIEEENERAQTAMRLYTDRHRAGYTLKTQTRVTSNPRRITNMLVQHSRSLLPVIRAGFFELKAAGPTLLNRGTIQRRAEQQRLKVTLPMAWRSCFAGTRYCAARRFPKTSSWLLRFFQDFLDEGLRYR
jgi:hypothetical protein